MHTDRDPLWSPGATAIWAALWIALTLHGQVESAGTHPLDRLQDPVRTAARWIDREYAQDPEAALWVADEVADYTDQWMDGDSAYEAAQREALLLAEDGDLESALELAPDQRTRNAIAWLYGDAARPRRDPSAVLAPALAVETDGWLSRSVIGRLETASADAEPIAQEPTPWVSAWWALWDSAWLRGLALLVALAWLAGDLAKRANAGARPPEGAPSLSVALGVWLRGDVLIQGIWLAGSLADGAAPESAAARAAAQASIWLAPLPLLWLAWRHWLGPLRARGVASPLSWPACGIRAALGLTLAAVIVDVVVSDAVSWLTWQAGWEGHWSEGIDDFWLWSGPVGRALAAADTVLWAPFVEEIAFRGLLYLGLRQRIGPLPAALLSSTLFAGLHFYAVPGMLVTLWSGLVWAWILERSGSLWPGVAAHAAYNAVWLAGLWLSLG